MAVRKSQQKCVNRYINKHYDRINVMVPKGNKVKIQELAKGRGMSVNALINELLNNELNRKE